jgi:hypothetical protein
MLQSKFHNIIVEESEDGSITYLFATRNNIVYTVYFNLDEYDKYLEKYPILLQKSYGFGFSRNPEKPKFKDSTVLPTIHDILLDFITKQDDDTVVLYHCQNNDANTMQAARERMFAKIYQDSDYKNTILKKSLEVELSVKGLRVPYFISLITKFTNPQLEQVLLEMDAFSVEIASESLDK